MRTKSVFLTALAFGTILISAHARAATLYTNGPISGGIGGLSLYGVNQATNNFTLGGPSTILSVTFGEWVDSGATPVDMDWEIGSFPFGADLGSATDVSLTLSLFCAAGSGCGDGQYDVYASGFTLDLPLPAGTYWLTLLNATTSSGLAYWDQNGGSSLVETPCCVSGYLSNSFTIASAVPEPRSVWLGGSGLLLLLAAGLRRAR